jgi:hypothetical protein
MLNMIAVCYFKLHGVSACTLLMNVLYFMVSIKAESIHYCRLYTTYFNVYQLHVLKFSEDSCHLLMWSLVYLYCEFESCLGYVAVCLVWVLFACDCEISLMRRPTRGSCTEVGRGGVAIYLLKKFANMKQNFSWLISYLRVCSALFCYETPCYHTM